MSARKHLLAGAVLLSLVGSAVRAESTTFLQFTADRDATSGYAEFNYDSALGLTLGDGATGTGDGNSVSPGLTMSPTGGVYYFPNLPQTSIPDSSMAFSADSFKPDGLATIGSGGSIFQNLTGGDFTITDSDGKVLLTGHAVSAQIERDLDDSAGILSGTVTYTGGILQGLLAGAGLTNVGTFSFNLSGLTGTTSIDGTGHLSSFLADGGGTFDAVPVPVPAATVGGTVLLGALAVSRVRRQRAIRA